MCSSQLSLDFHICIFCHLTAFIQLLYSANIIFVGKFCLDKHVQQNLNCCITLFTMDKMKSCRSMVFKSILPESCREKTTLQRSDMKGALKAECGSDNRWKFVTMLLNTILALKDVIKKEMERYNVLLQDMKNARPNDNSAPPMSPDTFSEDQKKTINTALQFVLGFGICPALQPGVGLPLEWRTEFHELLKVQYRVAALSYQNLLYFTHTCVV